ncbi:MAG TPA: Rieske (2Fe-2S) protein [Kofleriaceae bacterium]|jgi:Rieske Fe-S protein|nr:Rieske (2Fe-2S) protein [Kofleriaceae bacterium]
MDTAAMGGNDDRAMQLRVVPAASTGAGCAGCSRRAVLRGLALTAASALVGCPSVDGSLSGTDADDGGPGSTASACGANLCLDLNDPRNAALTAVDGTLVVAAPRDSILLVRSSTSAVQAVSDICTHAGCGVRYDHVNRILSCPCHGSQYTLTGMVLRGPAFKPLARYQTQLDASTNQLTILL